MFRKLVVALIAPLFVISACASEAADIPLGAGHLGATEAAGALAAMRDAPAVAAQAGSARFQMTISMSTPEGTFDVLSEGGFDGNRMIMSMDFGSAVAQAVAGTDEPVPPALAEPMQVMIDGTTAYLHIPFLQAVTGSSGWVSASAEELAASGGSLGFGDSMTEPTQILDMLTSVAGDVRSQGSEVVRGVDTEHYSATLDLGDALAAMPAEQLRQIETQLGGLSDAGTAIPIEVWIDAEGLVRRFVIDVAPTSSDLDESAVMATLTLELFDYGEDIGIELPDPAEVTPFSEMLGGFGGMR